MSFEQEWAGLKAAYVPEESTFMRLAGAGGSGSCGTGGSGGGPGGRHKKLHVTAPLLRTRAGRAETVRGQFMKADDEVTRETGQITGSLKGFLTDAAIATFQERWKDQMAHARQQFTHTAAALRTAADSFTTEDHKRAHEVSRAGEGARS